MDEATFDEALDYLDRSGMNQVRLLGGEPTQHPAFTGFVQKALDRAFDIMLFSNGLFSEKILDFLASIPEKRITILLNTIHPDENDARGKKQQQKVLKRLGKKIIPGINIYNAGQGLDYLLDYVIHYQLRKEIRIGISHSVLSLNNVYLHPKDYQNIGHNILMFKSKSKEAGVAIGFDCGFVPCMFPAAYHGLLSEELKKAGNCCHPIIDMLSDGTFISCYPLHHFMKVKMHDQLLAKDLIQTFDKALSVYKGIGIYTHCTSCSLFNKQCNGGCMSFRIQRFMN